MPSKITKEDLLKKTIKLPKFQTIIFDEHYNPHFIVPVSEYIPLTNGIFASTLNTCATTEVINKSLNKCEDSILIKEMNILLSFCPEFKDKINEYIKKVGELINDPIKTLQKLKVKVNELQKCINVYNSLIPTWKKEINLLSTIQDAENDLESDDEVLAPPKKQIQTLKDKITTTEKHIENLNQQIVSINCRIDILNSTIYGQLINYHFNPSKIIKSVSDKNKAMYMNYVGYKSWDMNGVNTDKKLSIIDRFLKDIDTNGNLYNNNGLSVLINEHDIPAISTKFHQICKTYYSNIHKSHKKLEDQIKNQIKDQMSNQFSTVTIINKEQINNLKLIVKNILKEIINDDSIVANIWDTLKETLAKPTTLSLNELADNINLQTTNYFCEKSLRVTALGNFFDNGSNIEMIIQKLKPCSTTVSDGMTNECKENIILKIFEKWNTIDDENYKDITGDLLAENYMQYTSFEALNIAISNDVYNKLKEKNPLFKISDPNYENLTKEKPEYYFPTNYLQILFGIIMQEHYSSSKENREKLFENFSNYIKSLKNGKEKIEGDIFEDIITKIFYGTDIVKDIEKIKQNMSREYELLGGALHATQIEKLDLQMENRTFSDGFFKENSGVFYVPLDEILKQYKIEPPNFYIAPEFKINNFKLEECYSSISISINSLLSAKNIGSFRKIFTSDDLSLEDKVNVLKLGITDKEYEYTIKLFRLLDDQIIQEPITNLLNDNDFIDSIMPKDFCQFFDLIANTNFNCPIIQKSITKILNNETFINSIKPTDFLEINKKIDPNSSSTILSKLLDNKTFINSIKPTDFLEINKNIDITTSENMLSNLLNSEPFLNSINPQNFCQISDLITNINSNYQIIQKKIAKILNNETFINSIKPTDFLEINKKIDANPSGKLLSKLLNSEPFLNSINPQNFYQIFSIIFDAHIDEKIVQNTLYKIFNNKKFIQELIKNRDFYKSYQHNKNILLQKLIDDRDVYKKLINDNKISQYNKNILIQLMPQELTQTPQQPQPHQILPLATPRVNNFQQPPQSNTTTVTNRTAINPNREPGRE